MNQYPVFQNKYQNWLIQKIEQKLLFITLKRIIIPKQYWECSEPIINKSSAPYSA